MKKKYDDQEIVKRIHLGDEFAEKALYEKYRIYSCSLAKEYYERYYGSGISYKEFYSVAIASVFLALKTYEIKRCHFYPYWLKISQRQMYSYIKDNSYLFGAKMFAGISLDDYSFEDKSRKNEESFGEYDLKEDDDDFETLFTRICKEYSLSFTFMEKKVMELLYKGNNGIEIAKTLKLTMPQVYYLRKKIKTKIAKILK